MKKQRRKHIFKSPYCLGLHIGNAEYTVIVGVGKRLNLPKKKKKNDLSLRNEFTNAAYQELPSDN